MAEGTPVPWMESLQQALAFFNATESTSSAVLYLPEETHSSSGDTFIILGLNREAQQSRGTPSLQRRKNDDTTGQFSAKAPTVILKL